MRSIVNPAPFVVDQSVSGSFVGSLRLPAQAEEHPKPLILCWRLETLIVTSEDCAAPPPHVPDPPSTPTVCTAPPSVGETGPTPLDPLPLPELEPAPEVDEPPEVPPEVEPLLEPDEPLEPSGVPELDPLELGALPEPEAAASLWGELPLVELLPHALAMRARHARHPISAEWRRTLLVNLSMSMTCENSREIVLPARPYLGEIGFGPHRAVAARPPIRHSARGPRQRRRHWLVGRDARRDARARPYSSPGVGCVGCNPPSVNVRGDSAKISKEYLTG
jgi:hypothetical protein